MVHVNVSSPIIDARPDDGRSVVSGTPPVGEPDWSPRQEEILDSLELLFLNEGFQRLTVGDLVEHLRCSRRTLYVLAPSREELVVVVIRRHLARRAAEARACVALDAEPVDAIACFLRTSVLAMTGSSPVATSEILSYGPTRDLYSSYREADIQILEGLIARATGQGASPGPSPAVLAEAFAGAVDHVGRPEVVARTGASPERAVGELVQLLRPPR